MTRSTRGAIALIGAGPRGTSLLERIGARLDARAEASNADHAPLDIHIIDDAPDGAGKIWRTDQTRELCMNTLADAVTLFTEPSSTISGPVVEGPTLYEWCVLALHAAFPSEATREVVAAIPEARAAAFEAFETRADLAADYRAELSEMLPESHPSRALYGEYLEWCYRRAIAQLPPNVRVIRHRTRATAIARDADGARDTVSLADGGQVAADAIVLATGWMPRERTAAETRFEHALASRDDLVWVRPDSPVDQDLSGIAPGSRAIIRGLGMGFFDTAALLTIGRGGEFVADPAALSGLRYVPSGREPVLHATSNRGVPFRAKTLYGSLPPAPAQRYLLGVDWAARPRPIDFNREFWPRIVADAYRDHADALHRVRPTAFAAPLERVRAAIEETLEAELARSTEALAVSGRPTELPEGDQSSRAAASAGLTAVAERFEAAVAAFLPDPADRLDLPGEMLPVHRDFASPAEYDAWVVDRTAHDLAEAELGHDSAVKAGLWSISAARGVASAVGTLGGFDAESRGTGFAALLSLGGMVGSGPPAFRNRQLLALVDAGIVRFIGPGARVGLGEHGFTAESPRVAGSAIETPVLIDAWMHFHDLSATADPLAESLLEAGRARAFRVATRHDGDGVATGAFDIDFATGLLIGESGELDRSVHVTGIPVDEKLHGTIISPMPGTDPPMLRETDRVAESALRIALGPAPSEPHPTDHELEGAAHV